ncbi:LysR family transcriptional regulator [Streptomyces sp. 3214.6]|uniref:LysR family transcriptional regulator n=1 Tax=Streptomyces sp. 3214.6 TaxID=1882757 RepID=UPI00135207E5|nr:LysR family transcriptional regulator [Streptomyces sp. 3214.6]
MTATAADAPPQERYGARVDMWHLRYFIAVAEELNFTRAAQRLSMSSSPLSRRIQDLEKALGQQLFLRDRRTTALTPAGEALLPLARDVVARFDAIHSALASAVRGPSSTATLGIGGEIPAAIRTRVLDTMHTAVPGMEIDIRPGAARYLLNALLAGELDMALVSGPVVDPGLSTHPVSRRPLGIVVAAGAGFDGRVSVRLEELAPLAFAMYGRDDSPTLLKHFDALMHDAGVHRRVTVESTIGLPHVVSTGHAFTIIALDETGVVKRIFEDEQVLCLPIDGTHLELTTVAAWRRDRQKPGDPVAGLADAVTGLALPAPTAQPSYG